MTWTAHSILLCQIICAFPDRRCASAATGSGHVSSLNLTQWKAFDQLLNSCCWLLLTQLMSTSRPFWSMQWQIWADGDTRLKAGPRAQSKLVSERHDTMHCMSIKTGSQSKLKFVQHASIVKHFAPLLLLLLLSYQICDSIAQWVCARKFSRSMLITSAFQFPFVKVPFAYLPRASVKSQFAKLQLAGWRSFPGSCQCN